jgi:hypothetical protein
VPPAPPPIQRVSIRLTNVDQLERILRTLGPALARLSREDRHAALRALLTLSPTQIEL